MFEILVLSSSFTMTRPFSSFFTPAAYRPRPSLQGLRPVLTSTWSALIVSFQPPWTGQTIISADEPRFFPESTLWPVIIFIFFYKTLWKDLAISTSKKGQIWSAYSTTTTSDPILAQTEPSSSPMTPPPMTINFLGICLMSRAPVELRMTDSSKGRPGKGVGSLPVAMIKFLAVILDLV